LFAEIGGIEVGEWGRCETSCLPMLLQWHFRPACKLNFIELEFTGIFNRLINLQKAVMVSHHNVIANTLQLATFEKIRFAPGQQLDVVLGLLPQSHIYSLVVICHANVYRGFGVINLPKFDLQQLLGAIQRFKINTLYLVRPVVIVRSPR
jgi:hypothetical protein